jgi:hypothetical protein
MHYLVRQLLPPRVRLPHMVICKVLHLDDVGQLRLLCSWPVTCASVTRQPQEMIRAKCPALEEERDDQAK